MKFVLIVFAAFHYEGGIDSQQVHFETMKKCEAAKAAIINDHLPPNGWDSRRITAVCVAI